MTIVCATHFTSSSLSAVRVAAALARRRQEPLFLVNVDLQAPLDLHRSRDPGVGLEELRRTAAELAGPEIPIGTEVLRGPLGRTVWQFCTARDAGLLVAGDTNHLTSALFESTLDQFAYGVDIPFLVVRDEKPLLAWALEAEPLEVLLALDRSFTSEHARDWISQLAQYGPLNLLASHVWWPTAERERRGLPRSHQNDADAPLEALIRREVEGALRTLPPNVKHRVHLEIGLRHVSDRLLAFSVAEHAELFVVGTHPHPERGPLGRLWSVSRDVLALAPMSVVCVPGPQGRKRALPEAGEHRVGKSAPV